MEKYPINFEEIKRKISIEDVINYFQLELKEVKPNQYRGNCPFLNHGGDRNSKSFSVNTEKGLFWCPTHCEGGKGVLSFYMELKGYLKHDVYQAGKELQNIFIKEIRTRTEHVINKPVKEKKVNPIYERRRLDLKPNVDYLLKTKKLRLETLKYFEVGEVEYGTLKNRIGITMYNKFGQLIGYCGQCLQSEKWKFFFKKSIELFNYHRVKKLKELKEVIIVESFYSAMYLHQSGCPNTIAVMGVSISDVQIDLFKELSDNFLLFFDNDGAGRKGSEILIKKFDKQGMKYRIASNSDKQKPLDYSPSELHKILS